MTLQTWTWSRNMKLNGRIRAVCRVTFRSRDVITRMKVTLLITASLIRYSSINFLPAGWLLQLLQTRRSSSAITVDAHLVSDDDAIIRITIKRQEIRPVSRMKTLIPGHMLSTFFGQWRMWHIGNSQASGKVNSITDAFRNGINTETSSPSALTLNAPKCGLESPFFESQSARLEMDE